MVFEYKVVSYQTGIIMQGIAMKEWKSNLSALGKESWGVYFGKA